MSRTRKRNGICVVNIPDILGVLTFDTILHKDYQYILKYQTQYPDLQAHASKLN